MDLEKLRSRSWFAGDDLDGYATRGAVRKMGVAEDVFDPRPVIGIANSFSEVATCNVHLRTLAEHVKRGVWRAGGFPMEFPAMSLSEPLAKPTTMLFRNLLAMEVEENIRSLPLDGVVLLSSCDKTTPGMLMGAASANVPAICLTGGPMIRGMYGSEELGTGTDIWRFWEEFQAGTISKDQWEDMQGCFSRSNGHCQVMGTASTMAAVVEGLGMSLPGAAAVPAVDTRRLSMAEATGRRIVEMAIEDLRPAAILTREAFENAIRVLMSVGGSTNAIVHLCAIAGRVGVDLPLELFDEISQGTPMLANLKPSGTYLMEDLHAAGGVNALIHELMPLLHDQAVTVTGHTIREDSSDARVRNPEVIASLDTPFQAAGTLVVLYGNLCPDGAILKSSAASASLTTHQGRAVVFEDQRDLMRRIDDPELDVDENSVLVLRNAGPVGGPGMPEWGHLPIPAKLLEQGVRDMVRISDARMSGTAYGMCILHVAPESAVGGPLALVRNGDVIALDVPNRRLDLSVGAEELAERRRAWTPPTPKFTRGYGRLYLDHVSQAPQGADFDFLLGGPDTDLEPYRPIKATVEDFG